MQYQITSVTQTEIKVQLTFDWPDLVSQGIKQDNISVKLNKDLFLAPIEFKGVNSLKAIDEEPYFFMTAPLPKMLKSEAELQIIQYFGTSSSSVVIAAVVIPFAVGLVLKGILSKLWAMINTMQLINILSVLNNSVPLNVMTVQKTSVDIVNFQPFSKEMVSQLMYGSEEKFPESEQINYPDEAQAQESGRMLQDFDDYEEENAIQASQIYSNLKIKSITDEFRENLKLSEDATLQTMLVLALAIAVCIIMICLVYLCMKSCVPKCHKFVKGLC